MFLLLFNIYYSNEIHKNKLSFGWENNNTFFELIKNARKCFWKVLFKYYWAPNYKVLYIKNQRIPFQFLNIHFYNLVFLDGMRTCLVFVKFSKQSQKTLCCHWDTHCGRKNVNGWNSLNFSLFPLHSASELILFIYKDKKIQMVSHGKLSQNRIAARKSFHHLTCVSSRLCHSDIGTVPRKHWRWSEAIVNEIPNFNCIGTKCKQFRFVRNKLINIHWTEYVSDNAF